MGTIEISPITGGTISPLIDAATITWVANQGFAYSVTLGGDRTFANPTSMLNGSVYTLLVTQDGTGSKTITWGTNYYFQAASTPTLSTAAGAIDILVFFSVGSTLYFEAIYKDFSTGLLAPSGLTASIDEVGQITLNWTNNSSAPTVTAIDIQRDDGIGFDTITSVAPNVSTYIDVVGAGDYPYRIRAAHNATLSPPSNTATGTSLP